MRTWMQRMIARMVLIRTILSYSEMSIGGFAIQDTFRILCQDSSIVRPK